MPPTYFELSRLLENVGADTGAAEAHGLLAGLVASGRVDEAQLVSEIFPAGPGQNAFTEESRESVLTLARETSAAFADPTTVFSPLLPLDDSPLKERALALRDWCEGFLYGLGVGEAEQRTLHADITEAVGDLGELTRLDVAIVGDSEEEEQAFADLVEFVRAAVMMIQAELAAGPEHAP